MNIRKKLEMRPWKTTARYTVYEHGKFLTIENHIVELPDGKIIDDWAWVISPDFANIIPVTDDNKVLCFRQFKYAVEGLTLAPIGGHLEKGEEPLMGAKRELLEEIGYVAEEWKDLGNFRPMANRGGGMGYSYLALGASKVTIPNSDDLEDQELLLLDFDEIEQALIQGEFKVFSWAATVALALLHIRGGESPPPAHEIE
jgi:ADP-ribose pyrophosphatase